MPVLPGNYAPAFGGIQKIYTRSEEAVENDITVVVITIGVLVMAYIVIGLGLWIARKDPIDAKDEPVAVEMT